MTIDYGTALAMDPKEADIAQSLSLVSGPSAVIPAAINAILTSRGSIPYAPNVGAGLGSIINAKITDEYLSKLKSQCISSVKSDPRVKKCTVNIRYSPMERKLTTSVWVFLDDTQGVGFEVVKSVADQSFTVRYLAT